VLFESKTDREYEGLFADYMGAKYKVEALKVDKKYGPDFFVSGPDGSPRSWVEFKQRDARILEYPTAMISAYKIWRGRSLADSTGLKFVFAIGVKCEYVNEARVGIDQDGADNIITYRSVEITPEVVDGSWLAMGGRKDRGYIGDIEPMYHIPWAFFRDI